jgi:hypothetical protein
MGAAEETLAKGTLEPGMQLGALRLAAVPGPVPTADLGLVVVVLPHVFRFAHTSLSRAYGVDLLKHVGVCFAEVPSAVLARVHGVVLAAAEPAPKLAASQMEPSRLETW